MRVRSPLTIANLLLLLIYPAAWLAPLAEAGLLPYFGGSQITIVGGVAKLWEADPALSILVALFAIVIPYGKTLALAAIHFRMLGGHALPAIEIIGKLSMADVFLIALYIVMAKGVGVGYVATSWGLWLFTLCVLGSLWIGHATKKMLA